MKKPPDENSTEILLKGIISQPSERFEAALRTIPGRERHRARLKRFWIMAPIAAAALLVLATLLFIEPIRQDSTQETIAVSPVEDLESAWVELFSLADAMAEVDSLTNEETRLALEFYAFNE